VSERSEDTASIDGSDRAGRVPAVTLNTGATIPQLGLGTARVTDDREIRRIVATALEVGYRHVDTAASYDNEVGVGKGIADAGLPRDEVFVTTKLRGSQQGADTRVALEQSLERLGLDHVDLYLIHWPLPKLDRYVESWLIMEDLAAAGLTKAIGVSNFLPEHLDRLAAASSTVPAVNQIELHPREPQLAQRADDARRGIVTEAWSPLTNAGNLLKVHTLVEIGERYYKTPVQVVLRWHVQQGVVVIPKASHVDRLRQNLDIFDFTLSDDDLARMATLATGELVNDQDPRTWEEF
jgi:diketogulonate reductase-like aldo/keto reductase